MIVLAATIDTLRSRKDRTWGVTLGTQELTPEQATEVMKLANKLCFVSFKIDPFTNQEEQILASLEGEPDLNAKSLSERLRNVLYVKWTQTPQGFKEFKDFYEHYMNRYIDNIKNTLEP
jgi:hypothetical protein